MDAVSLQLLCVLFDLVHQLGGQRNRNMLGPQEWVVSSRSHELMALWGLGGWKVGGA